MWHGSSTEGPIATADAASLDDSSTFVHADGQLAETKELEWCDDGHVVGALNREMDALRRDRHALLDRIARLKSSFSARVRLTLLESILTPVMASSGVHGPCSMKRLDHIM
jgi:hypothetical protein